MYDLRAEAEMRLHSEKLAKELARKKQRENSGEDNDAGSAPTADGDQATADPRVTTCDSQNNDSQVAP